MKKTNTKQALEELTLILMYLTRFSGDTPFSDEKIYRAWKGYDFDVVNRLWEEDFVFQGKNPYKSKSVTLSKKGIEHAKDLLEKYKIDDWK